MRCEDVDNLCLDGETIILRRYDKGYGSGYGKKGSGGYAHGGYGYGSQKGPGGWSGHGPGYGPKGYGGAYGQSGMMGGTLAGCVQRRVTFTESLLSWCHILRGEFALPNSEVAKQCRAHVKILDVNFASKPEPPSQQKPEPPAP